MKDYFQIDLLKNGKIIVKMDMISYWLSQFDPENPSPGEQRGWAKAQKSLSKTFSRLSHLTPGTKPQNPKTQALDARSVNTTKKWRNHSSPIALPTSRQWAQKPGYV